MGRLPMVLVCNIRDMGLFKTDLSLILALYNLILLDFSLTVKAATLIFISRCGSAISSAKEGKSGFIFRLVKS